MSIELKKIGQKIGSSSKTKPDITDIEGIQELGSHTDTRGPIRLGFWVLIVGFGGFLLWSALAPLDEGVAAQATVSMESRRKTIQHFSGGVVRQVLVKEGQWVKEGDVLVELGEATSRANFEAVRQNYMSQRATESRLLAELKGLPAIIFHADLLKAESDPLVQQHMQTQRDLFQSRRASNSASTLGISTMLENRKIQATLQAQQLSAVQELATEGYASRNQVLQMEQTQAELRSMIADLTANYTRVRQDYLKEVSAQLAEVRREVQSGQERLAAASEDLARTQIRSPVDGQVIGLSLGSTGGVVTPGQRLMDVIPKGEILMIDAKIPPHVIDKVYAGEVVDVRFSTFANSPQLVLNGKLTSVSSDVIVEQSAMGTISYYLARVEITPEGIRQLGKRVMQPGMPAEVLINTGERTLLTYLMHPLTKRLASAMKEE